MERDYARDAQLVEQRINAVQKPWEDNSSQEKHNERGRIALDVHQQSFTAAPPQFSFRY